MGARVRGVGVVVVVLVTGAVLGTWIAQWMQAPGSGSGVGTVSIPTVFGPRVRVEVKNGGGRSGMARSATDVLRDEGLDVVEMGNWEDFQVPESFVLDRVGDVAAARRVADLLGIREVRSDAGTNLYADVTVVLGQDWSPDLAPPRPSPGTGTGPWWDLRQYL
ncbi:MAG TPA: LytR C-terminal domain-containing protein, partial [Longimicrobiales bacterium]|nr:LytR C-terminal domain-containing protein [Longimicrobiales bacterium]